MNHPIKINIFCFRDYYLWQHVENVPVTVLSFRYLDEDISVMIRNEMNEYLHGDRSCINMIDVLINFQSLAQ